MDWIKPRGRKGDEYGTIVHDDNWRFRILTAKMDNGNTETITMNNIGPDPNPEELAKWEFFWDTPKEQKWIRFSP